MDELQKLLVKMKKADRTRILNVLKRLQTGDTASLKIEKLKGSKLYRLRTGRYRIILSVDKKKKLFIVEHVRLRDEKTYK